MATFQKKVCMLGASGVGKTSLVRRLVYSKFDDSYLSTLGVKIDRCALALSDDTVNMMLWDVAGEEEHFQIPPAYFRGTSGTVLVVDGTRPDTVDVAFDIYDRLCDISGPVPVVVAANKSDLTESWRLNDQILDDLRRKCGPVHTTSALSGAEVLAAFRRLAEAMVPGTGL